MGSGEAASKGPAALYIHFCRLSKNSKQQIGAQSQTRQQYSMQGHIVGLQRYRATSGERNFIEQIKVQIFLQEVLAIEIMQEPPSNLEEKVNPSLIKDDFSLRKDPLIFTSIVSVLLNRSNKTSQVFPVLISTSHFLAQPTSHFLPKSTISRRLDSSSEANSSCYHNITNNIIRKIINVSQEKCRTKNGALRNFSINWIFL